MSTPFVPKNGTPTTLEGATLNGIEEWMQEQFTELKLDHLAIIVGKHVRDKLSQDICIVLMQEDRITLEKAMRLLCNKWGIRIEGDSR